MNYDNLRAEISRNRLTAPKLAKIIKISKKTIYSRLNGKTEFKQNEIALISKALNLDDNTTMDIFFAH